MALDLNGNAVPVALLADPYAHQIILASQTGNFGMADKSMNPLDLFAGYMPTDSFGLHENLSGVAVVILNAAAAPLRLVEAINPVDNGRGLTQRSYPVTYDFDGKPTKVHEIPGTRTYPRPANHRIPGGGPRLMGGVGVYRYIVGHHDSSLSCAMRFTCSADSTGPQIGLAFRADWSQGNVSTHWAISADVVGKHGDLNSFYKDTSGASTCNAYDVNTSPGLAVWGRFPSAQNAKPDKEPDMHTFTVWIRDVASTLGSE